MEPGQRRGPEAPRGVALAGRERPRLPAGPAGHGSPRQRQAAPCPADTPPAAGGPRPGVRGEEPPCCVAGPRGCGGEEPRSTAGFPGELPAGQPETGRCVVALPPCHGRPGPSVGVLPPEPAVALPGPAATAGEQAREPLPRGRCLIRNWQEERATNELDQVPSPELGSEGIFYRHGHRGLLTPQQCACLADSTTMKDAYRRPVPTGLPQRGQREAMLELMLYHKYREETLREHCPRPAPMESLSTMRQDYRREGFCSAPPPPTQPHDYRMEQPRSFWLENAARIPGVTKPRAGDTPFKRNAAFSTPVEDSPWGWHRPGTVSPSEPRPLLPPTLGKALAISGFR